MCLQAVADLTKRAFHCSFCQKAKRSYEIYQVTLPYAAKLLFQELLSMSITPRMLFGGEFDH